MDFVFEKFRSEIESKGMKIDSIDESGLIYIIQGELTLKVSLDNARKNYERDKDETHITDLVESLIGFSADVPDNWEEAKDRVYISLFPNDFDFQESVHQKITDEFRKVYVLSKTKD